ncbi:hypothetical protein [Pseudomonas saliphila]|uniref:hypothetical protein n=1 Tax=Pseudomonas saliphila TaxID=2586906 RepID=UPI00123AFF39|nr:hypothetical protein [Pseudomonas saliphila]
MVEWIEANQTIIEIGVSIATMLIWLIYAQLLYFGFRRQRTPRVIINRGREKDLDALCIISNMSKEAIYVEYLLATLKTSVGNITMDVTDFEQSVTEEREDEEGDRKAVPVTPENVRENTRQGPLLSGEFMHIGTFGGLVKRLARHAGIPMQGYRPEGDIRLECLTIQLIALYGPEPRPISATRDFNIKSDHAGSTLTPTSWGTRQGISFLHRRHLSKKVNELNNSNFSVDSTVRLDKD